MSTCERQGATREVQVASTIPPALLKPGRCFLQDIRHLFSSSKFICVLLPPSSNTCFHLLPGSHVALWPRTKVLWPRGKTAFVQLQLRSVLRRNDWQRGHTAAESRPGRLNLVQSRLCHLVCAELSILMITSIDRFYTYPQPPKPSMLHVIDGTWKVRF